ncbi:MAG: hypothetical protein FJZ64_00365 [Chlamydiae bacterium]|nr:hypothetical protein [Chlamydiota bacterium]
MFLEKVGILCFGFVRPLFFYLLLLLPLFFAGGYWFYKSSALQEIENRCLEIIEKEKSSLDRKKRKERFLHRYAHADPFFLDKQIESLPFLQNERSRIKALMNHPASVNKNELSERFQFIESQKNRLMFTEGKISSAASLKETEEKQRFPVQMDANDLEKVLAMIEDIKVGNYEPLKEGPQFIITDFKLVKKETPLHFDTYEVEMDLIKREWINP